MTNKTTKSSVISATVGLALVGMYVFGPTDDVKILGAGLLILLTSTGAWYAARRYIE